MSKAMIYTTWDEYYKSRVRNNEYRDAFRLKYGLFLKEIIFNIKRQGFQFRDREFTEYLPGDT